MAAQDYFSRLQMSGIHPNELANFTSNMSGLNSLYNAQPMASSSGADKQYSKRKDRGNQDGSSKSAASKDVNSPSNDELSRNNYANLQQTLNMLNHQGMSMHGSSNLQKELLAMSVAAAASMNPSKEADQHSKPKKGKSSARGTYSQNKSQNRQFQTSARLKDEGHENTYAPAKSDMLQSTVYSG